ncbi:5-bromo-4-chloroindolyl phosphate hydrolysis family protein [Feifania hominis]|uniref:5-bromo-4-chloroindolyl phosphate hydrolysis family protein n=1 Tax=Feifania hominis TaxID=2763660 RepID=A0A926DDB3_9FIRM|nr:5-bromo-4-chloroindolyl phosphate hydrolysis family protein [Feifania hominis]MBC8536860.1 5-bromo-4-chloroindolyl phosphate hydrolysis family protein [Feifania hominis]
MREKKIKTAIPIYLAAGVFVLLGILIPLTGIGAILGVLAAAAVTFAVADRLIPARTVMVREPEPEIKTGDETVDEAIAQGRRGLEQLRRANELIPDEVLSAQIGRMETAGDRILKLVAQHPEKLDDIRRFLNYFLPTANKLLAAYARLTSADVRGENVAEATTRIRDSMELVARAFERQLDRLYHDEALDITTDIQVLESMMASEGLLDQNEFKNNKGKDE